MRTERTAGAATLLWLMAHAAPALAESFNVPPGPLGAVAAAIGGQAHATIVITDPVLAAEPSPGARGAMPLREALRQALRGTDAQANFLNAHTARITRSAAHPPAHPGETPPPPISTASEDIVVTATKRPIGADRYPGSVARIALDPEWVAEHAHGGTQAITRLLPMLAATDLGDGRDKLFIRGIADSSFAGPTQATTGQYLGDIRLTYNAPDPDLNLYDMRRVEVLEGPQGTLYGAGSLGGVIRFVPNAPDIAGWAASASSGLSGTASGAASWDGAGMLNVPIVPDRLALRLVVYGARDGGYIDDLERGLSNINATVSRGERFALRLRTAHGWTVDIGYVEQNIASRDSQYALAGDPPLTRASAIAQPSGNLFQLGYITAHGPAGSDEITTTTSIGQHHLSSVFDATGYDGTSTPALFGEDNNINVISHETRLSGGSRAAPYVIGVSALVSTSVITRRLGPMAAPAELPGIANLQAETALFAEGSLPLSHRLTGTLGARLTYDNGTGIYFTPTGSELPRVARNVVQPTFTLALDWHPGGRLSAFAHYEQGYRAGGLAIAPAGSGVATQKFDGDELNMDEIGLRLGDESHGRFWLRASAFWADWNHIQADLVDSAGLTTTANIGRGRIYGLEGEASWRPRPAFKLSGAFFINESRLTAPTAAFAAAAGQPLPNVGRGGGRIAAQWLARIGRDTTLTAEASGRYVGKSLLGVGPTFDIPQGNYAVADAALRLERGRFALSLNLDNLDNAHGNTFAFGNPFTLDDRRQMTPLRPRTLRLGISARY